jgi:hypothetical protein
LTFARQRPTNTGGSPPRTTGGSPPGSAWLDVRRMPLVCDVATLLAKHPSPCCASGPPAPQWPPVVVPPDSVRTNRRSGARERWERSDEDSTAAPSPAAAARVSVAEFATVLRESMCFTLSSGCAPRHDDVTMLVGVRGSLAPRGAVRGCDWFRCGTQLCAPRVGIDSERLGAARASSSARLRTWRRGAADCRSIGCRGAVE